MRPKTLIATTLAAILGACGGAGDPALTGTMSYGDRVSIELLDHARLSPSLSGLPAGVQPNCSLVGGSLPPGIALVSDCTLQGRATAAGTYSGAVVLTAAGYRGQLDATAAITVSPVALSLQSRPDATTDLFVGGPVNVQVVRLTGYTAREGDEQTFAITGSLPEGLSLDPTSGVLSGIPTTIERTVAEVTASLRRGDSRVVVGPEPLTLQTRAPAAAELPNVLDRSARPVFFDANRAWLPDWNAAMSSGRVLRTSNGGRTWTSLPMTVPWEQAVFLSSQIGFVAGPASGAGNDLWNTVDGGLTLTRVAALPRMVDGTSYNYSVPRVVGSDPARLMITRVPVQGGASEDLYTTDGGSTWARSQLSAPTLTPGGTAIQLHALVTLGLDRVGSWLRRSGDLGATFQDIRVPHTELLSPMAFLTDREGWVVARPITIVGFPLMLRTMDGGTTWVGDPSLSVPRGFRPRGLHAASAKHLISWADVRDGEPSIYDVSLDGGKTWTAVFPPVRGGDGVAANRPFPINLAGAFYARGDHCNEFHVTSDWSVTWTLRTVPLEAGAAPDASCTGSQVVWPGGQPSTPWVLSGGFWYRSADSGATWQRMLRAGF